MKCKGCGNEFHYCSSCSPIRDHDRGYCCEDCWLGSEDMKTKRETLEYGLAHWSASGMALWLLEVVWDDEDIFQGWVEDWLSEQLDKQIEDDVSNESEG